MMVTIWHMKLKVEMVHYFVSYLHNATSKFPVLVAKDYPYVTCLLGKREHRQLFLARQILSEVKSKGVL